MRWPWRKPPRPPEAADGQLASMTSGMTFTLAPGHPLRGAPCVLCDLAIGGNQVRVAGVVALGGRACQCGSVLADMYLAHAAHGTPSLADLTGLIRGRVFAGHEHDWEPVR